MLLPPQSNHPSPPGPQPPAGLVLPFAGRERRKPSIPTGAGLALLVTPVHRLDDGALCGGDIESAFAPTADSAAMLNAACGQAARWQGGPAWGARLRAFVKLPHKALHGDKLDRHLAGALHDAGLSPDLMELAFSQDELECDSPELGLRLSALRDLGAGVALDTTGLGQDLLRVLRRLPITAIRLAPSLVAALEACNTARSAALDAICLAHASGAAVVALGVGTACQRDILADMQCDEAQGLGVADAVSAEAFARALT